VRLLKSVLSVAACAAVLSSGCGDKKSSNSGKPKRTKQVVNAPAPPRTVDCSDVAAKAAATWNTAAKSKLKAAFADTAVAHAADTFERVAARLDAYKQAIAAQSSKTCRFMKRVCIDRRLGSMAALLAALSTAGKRGVDRALRAVYRLPVVAWCADSAYVDSQPRPSKANGAKLERLYQQLDRLRMHMYLGRTKNVAMELRAVAFAAQRMQYAPAAAETLQLQARAARAQGKLRRAQQSLSVAAQIAAKAKDDRRVASVWIELVSVLVDARRIDDAFKVVKGAKLALQGSKHKKRLERRLQEAIAMARYQQGKYTEALEATQRALDLVAKGDDIAAAQVLFLKAAALEGAGKLADAERVYTHLRETVGKAFGPKHPMVGRVLIALGRAQVAQKQYDAGLANIERAIAAFRQTYGDSHPHVATAMAALARAQVSAKHYDKALATYKRVLAIRTKTAGPEHRSVGRTLLSIARAHFAAGQVAQARASAKRAREVFEKAKSKPGVAAVDKFVAKLAAR